MAGGPGIARRRHADLGDGDDDMAGDAGETGDGMNDRHTTAIASTLAAGFKARPGCAADLISLSAFFGLTYEDFVAAQVPADQLRAIRKQ